MRLVIYVNILIYVSDGKFFLMETSDTSKESKLGIDYDGSGSMSGQAEDEEIVGRMDWIFGVYW